MSETQALSVFAQLASASGAAAIFGLVINIVELIAIIATPILLYKIYRRLK